MASKKTKSTPAGMPSEIAEKQGLSTNDITEGKDTGSWFVQPDVDEKIDEYVKKEGNNEPLSGTQGLVAKGNQGDNAIANPDAPDTTEVTERHNEELAKLQNAIGDTDVVTGSIPATGNITEEAASKEVRDINDTEEPITENSLNKAPESANLDFSDYIKNYYGPKNGADYLKSLWAQGAGGKAKAVGNVLGNILGATGKGLAGQDYKSDWQQYKDNYTKEIAERNQKAFDQNMGIANQLRTNDVARGEMLKALDQYAKVGKNMNPEKFENIRKALTATGNSSQAEYYLASALGDLTSDPEFMNAVKGAGENATQLLSNLTQFGANTLRPLNYVFGGGWK